VAGAKDNDTGESVYGDTLSSPCGNKKDLSKFSIMKMTTKAVPVPSIYFQMKQNADHTT